MILSPEYNRIELIPEIFTLPALANEKVESKKLDKNNSYWVEFISHLSQFNEMDSNKTFSELEFLLTNVSKSENDPVVLTGMARCCIGNGQFLRAAQYLGKAYSKLIEGDPNIKSFVQLEMVNFLAQNDQFENALLLLTDFYNNCTSEYLRRIADYYHYIITFRKSKKDITPLLMESLNYFEGQSNYVMVAYHYKYLANISRVNGSFELAEKNYEKSLSICQKHKLSYISENIYHDIGMLNFRKGDYYEAIAMLSNVYHTAVNNYTRSYSIGNAGFISFKLKDYENSIDYFRKSLTIAQENGIIHLIPGCCYYLGKSYLNIKDKNKAENYLELGAKMSLELLKNKFTLKGEKVSVIESYIDFQKKYYSNNNKEREKQYDLSFAVGRTLKEIRAIFQQIAIDERLREKKTVKESVASLEISPSSYSKIRNRIKKYKMDHVPNGIKYFVSDYNGSNWKELNNSFESYLFEFLLKEYGHNKKRMSKILNVSYPSFTTLVKKRIEKREFLNE